MTDAERRDQSHNTENKNMYGMADCPKCGSRYRWPTQPTHPTDPNTILCDDCGYKEPCQVCDLHERREEK